MLKVRSFYDSAPELFALAVFDETNSLCHCNSCYSEEFGEYGFDRLSALALADRFAYINAQRYFIDRLPLFVSGRRFTAFSLELCETPRSDFESRERLNPLAVIGAYTSGSPTKQVTYVGAILDSIRDGDRREKIRLCEVERGISGTESASFSAGAFICALHVAGSIASDGDLGKRVEIRTSKTPNELSVSLRADIRAGKTNEFLVCLLNELAARGGFSVDFPLDADDQVVFSFRRVNLLGLPLAANKLRDIDLAMLLLFEF